MTCKTLQDKYADKLEKENKQLKEQKKQAIEILNAMKNCELLLGGNKKSNINKLLEILGDKENE